VINQFLVDHAILQVCEHRRNDIAVVTCSAVLLTGRGQFPV